MEIEDQSESLVLSNNSDVFNYLQLVVNGSMGLSCNIELDTDNAVSIVETSKSLKVIICDYSLVDSCEPLFAVLSQLEVPMPIVFVGNSDQFDEMKGSLPKNPWIYTVNYESKMEIIEGAVNRAMNISDNVKKRTSYCPVRSDIILSFGVPLWNIYLKISDKKYLKIFGKGKDISPEQVTKYKTKGCEYFYLRADDFKSFMEMISKKFIEVGEADNENISDAAKARLTVYGNEMVNTMINSVGISDDALKLANSNMKIAFSLAKKNKKLASLLKILLSSNNYIPEHSIMVSVVSCAIASELEWSSESSYTKLTMAAFFHDILITNPDICKIRGKQDESSSNFEYGELKKYYKHPEEVAKLFNTFNRTLPDIDKILIQHHEKPDGSGFPRGIDYKRIFSLSAVFIVAEEFVSCVFEMGLDDLNIRHILDGLDEIYLKKGNFDCAVKALRSALSADLAIAA